TADQIVRRIFFLCLWLPESGPSNERTAQMPSELFQRFSFLTVRHLFPNLSLREKPSRTPDSRQPRQIGSREFCFLKPWFPCRRTGPELLTVGRVLKCPAGRQQDWPQRPGEMSSWCAARLQKNILRRKCRSIS